MRFHRTAWKQSELAIDRFSGIVLLASLNRIVDFAAMNWHFARSFHPKPYFIATDLDDNDTNIIVDYDAFVFLT
ncbi:hypothetical protein Mal33_35730 [Rosistilla oblonga]|uniref:Uncharacterized protein n=1 Tax=Rosistilla oblonga TaxID=2527990 RepID=A0A518IWV0_9BACT|nr:hypothetical protein Mal33_35730 [Rosistilla oblonga]